MADIEKQMYQVLKAEGLKDLEFLGVMDSYVPWDQHLSDFDKATYPLMLDTSGVVYIYSASTYDVYLIDKKGRLVTKEPGFSIERSNAVNKRIRELHAE